MSIIKKKVRVEQEFLKCDFCDKITEEESGEHYIEECSGGCRLHVCPDHRHQVSSTLAMCSNCNQIWKVIALYDATKEKIKNENHNKKR